MAQAWLGAGLGEPEVPGYRGVRKALPSYQERVTANGAGLSASPLLLHDQLPGGQIFLSHCLWFCLFTKVFYGFQNLSKRYF